jgi:hypothetical protein
MLNIKMDPAKPVNFAADKEQWLDAVFADRHTSLSAKIVARTISTYFNRLQFEERGVLLAWPSTRTLDKKTGMSRNTVLAATKNLEVRGWIKVRRNRTSAGHSRANTYFACKQFAPYGSVRCVDPVHTGAPDSMNDLLIDSITRHSPRAASTASQSRALRSESIFDMAEQKWGVRGRKIAAMAARSGVSNQEILDAMEQNDEVTLFASDTWKFA